MRAFRYGGVLMPLLCLVTWHVATASTSPTGAVVSQAVPGLKDRSKLRIFDHPFVYGCIVPHWNSQFGVLD
jgi:hypothetical protein